MIVTDRTKKYLNERRYDREIEKKGYIRVGSFIGALWDLQCGCLSSHKITDVQISGDGKELWIKTQSQH